MKMLLDINIKLPKTKINYRDRILVIGSCFTEHIGGRLQDLKFQVLQNPNGILFDPLSVAASLNAYLQNKQYKGEDLFYLNELWQSWDHHSRFSSPGQQDVLANINASQQEAHKFLLEANWLVITLGSAFHYQLSDGNKNVANCHRAPGQWFDKVLVDTDRIIEAFANTIIQIRKVNPTIKIVFTISPVRHIRDGVVENNRSKARLIEAVHSLVDQFETVSYFPAYELVIDVLRDYRFYDIDLVHPNYPATEFVFDKFTSTYIDTASQNLLEEIKKIVTAFKHKPFHPTSNAHKAFLEKNLQQAKQIQEENQQIDLSKEIGYFSNNI